MTLKILNKALQMLTPKKNASLFFNYLSDKDVLYFDDSVGIDINEKIKNSNEEQYSLTGSINTTLTSGS